VSFETLKWDVTDRGIYKLLSYPTFISGDQQQQRDPLSAAAAADGQGSNTITQKVSNVLTSTPNIGMSGVPAAGRFERLLEKYTVSVGKSTAIKEI
jgi:hypothetical protein